MSRYQFEVFGTSHWAVIIASTLCLYILVALSRRGERWAHRIAFGLGGLLLLNYLVYTVYRIDQGHWSVKYDLPMEFCNWAAFITAAACFWRKQFLFELSYYMVLAGSIQGVVTPDLWADYNHIYFYIFHMAHAGLVMTVLYLLWGLHYKPRHGSALKAFFFCQFYFIAALVTSFTLETNYGYMREKPGQASLLDLMGPWPWYLLSFELVALLFFHLLYLPFYIQYQRQAKS